MNEKEVLDLLVKGIQFEGLSGIRLVETQIEPKLVNLPDPGMRPDVMLRVDFDGKMITVYGEVKTQVTPKTLKELSLWLARFKALNRKDLYVLICPFLSPESQKYCQENQIDFIDLSGNISLRIPGKILIQRLGRSNVYRAPQLYRDPFGGASSRVVRILLQFPNKKWGINDIEKELKRESERQNSKVTYELSLASISKTVQSLEENLLIRRDKRDILVPDPRQLLSRWVLKYRERYKWLRRSAWSAKNPFGTDFQSSIKGLMNRFTALNILLTGTGSSNLIAPFTDVDRIDLYLMDKASDEYLQTLNNENSVGPDFLFIKPYDVGVSMYCNEINGIQAASSIQTYLDCYAQGGRDVKQAEYLLSSVIEKLWQETQ